MQNKYILLLAIIFTLVVINWRFPVLRFTNNFANDFFSLLASAIPIVLCVVLFIKLSKVKIKFIALLGYLLVAPVCLLCFIVFCFKIASLPPLHNNLDGSFKKVHQLKNGVAIYRTNGGATTAFGIVVRQEKTILPGLMAVKPLFYKYRLEDINYEITGNKLSLFYWDGAKVVWRDIEIKRFLYF